MTSREKLEEIKEHFVHKLGAQETRWRIKRTERTGYLRYRLIEAMYKAKQPLSSYHLAYIFNKSTDYIRNNVIVLVEAGVLCNKLKPEDEHTRKMYYTVCPICPAKTECDHILPFWIKSGLMEEDKLPSEEFFEGAGH